MGIERVNIVVCADEGFALGAWMTIWSTWKKCSDPTRLCFHLVTTTPEGRAITKLQALAIHRGICLSVVPIDDGCLLGLPTNKWLPTQTYLRLLIPQALPKITRFLYLDADLLVLSCVLQLINDLTWGSTVAGARDYLYGNVGRGLGRAAAEMNLVESSIYLNAGILAVNADRWRTRGVTEQVLRYLEEHRSLVMHGDQDGINAVLSDDCQEIDAAWNVQIAAIDFFDRTGWPVDRESLHDRRSELLSSAKLVHFIGPAKPWNDGLFVPYGSEYRKVLIDSGWVSRSAAPFWKATWYCRASVRAVRRRFSRR